MVQWLRLCASTTAGPGSIPGEGTKIPMCHRMWPRKEKGVPELLHVASTPQLHRHDNRGAVV